MEYKFIIRIKDKFSFVSYSNSIDLHIKDPQHIFSSYSWETRKLGRCDSYLRNHSPTHPLTDIASKKWNRNLILPPWDCECVSKMLNSSQRRHSDKRRLEYLMPASCIFHAMSLLLQKPFYIHAIFMNWYQTTIFLKEKLITSALFKTINVPCSLTHLTWQAVRLNFILNLHHSDVTAAPCVVLHIQEA